MEGRDWLVITNEKGNWLSGAVKRASEASLGMLRDTAPAVRYRKGSDGSWVPTRWSITLSVLRMVAATGILICVSVASNLTPLMEAVWAIARPKAFARKSKPN